MKRFNLSAWAFTHPALVLFLIVCSARPGHSYLSLGRAEDPSFAIKTMVITPHGPAPLPKRCRIRSPTSSKSACRSWSYSTTSRPTRGPASPSSRCSSRTAAREVEGRLVPGAQEADRQHRHCPRACRARFRRRIRRRLFCHLYAVGGRLARQAQDCAEIVRQTPVAHRGRRQGRHRRRPQKIFIEFSHVSWRRSASRPRPFSTAWRARMP